MNSLIQIMPTATYITDGAKIYKLTDFVLHKVLMKDGEENHLWEEMLIILKELYTLALYTSFKKEKQEIKRNQ